MKSVCLNLTAWSSKILTVWTLLSLFLFPAVGLSFTDRIIAIVNKEVITRSDLEHEIQDEYKRLKAKFHGEELERRYRQKQREVLNHLIEDRLQIQEAKAKGLDVTQEEIDAALRRTPLPPTQTEEEFSHQMLLKKLFDFEVRRNVVVEEEELRRYYDANPTLFLNPPQYRLKQILFAGKEEFERERAKKKAQAIYAAWKPDTVLEDLASQHFVQVSELGWVQENELLDPLAQVVKDLVPGQLSPPIETLLGFHLLVVEDIQKPQPVPFENVEREIRGTLMKQRSDEAYRTWLAELKHKAFIEIKF
ncbi:MAG: peptidyl-prolyl cis-trans isomerase [Nitrospirota bacterium]|jgi:peptidyl-prolyl cis-trans isomerase SurA|nr:peptidyl-prolyl cis-trans isomerase [Nitrospirota bacterium]MDH4361750.1 peptidyl-prolyl cis-trans isomerase [Nitrospirota bacterium]MDH5295756.1 peptidyl-prolyl cis-trans isomerase [Nitrospirota bacterium]MDH5576149.1 peptidyl-prolyl cis-trans isomerase [Nitrospirota bacterium]